MTKLTQKTLVPLGFAIVLIGTGAGWVTKINYEVMANAGKIVEAKVVQREVLKALRSIDKKLAVIEYQIRRKNGPSKN